MFHPFFNVIFYNDCLLAPQLACPRKCVSVVRIALGVYRSESQFVVGLARMNNDT